MGRLAGGDHWGQNIADASLQILHPSVIAWATHDVHRYAHVVMLREPDHLGRGRSPRRLVEAEKSQRSGREETANPVRPRVFIGYFVSGLPAERAQLPFYFVRDSSSGAVSTTATQPLRDDRGRGWQVCRRSPTSGRA
jgi:hypothetical protein